MATLFFSYSHKDEGLRDQLEMQLAMLKRQGVIETWHDRRINAGAELHGAISEHIENDDIIVLLISPDFLASDYCYDVEMARALERHAAHQAVIIPVILRPCEWHHAPFGKLMATPPDGLPVTQWPDKDQAFLEIAKAIRGAAATLDQHGGNDSPGMPTPRLLRSEAVHKEPPRSSNLALAKRFTDRDKDAFKVEAFEYMAAFFENSLKELGSRNGDIEGAYRRVDANRFFATAYRDGRAASRMTVFIGGMFQDTGISHTQGETMASNSFNETLSVEADDQSLFLRPMGFGSGRSEPKLSFEGAAEEFWSTFMQPLRRRG